MCNTCPVLVLMASAEHSCPRRQHRHTCRFFLEELLVCACVMKELSCWHSLLTTGRSCRQRRDPDSKRSESLGLLAKIVGTSANSPENGYKCATPLRAQRAWVLVHVVCLRMLWPQRAHCFRKALTVSQHPKTLRLCVLDLAQCRAPGRAGATLPLLRCGCPGTLRNFVVCGPHSCASGRQVDVSVAHGPQIKLSVRIIRTPSLGVSMLTGIAFSTGRPTYRV